MPSPTAPTISQDPYPTSRDDDAFTTSANVLGLCCTGYNFETIRSLLGRSDGPDSEPIDQRTRKMTPDSMSDVRNKTNVRAPAYTRKRNPSFARPRLPTTSCASAMTSANAD